MISVGLITRIANGYEKATEMINNPSFLSIICSKGATLFNCTLTGACYVTGMHVGSPWVSAYTCFKLIKHECIFAQFNDLHAGSNHADPIIRPQSKNRIIIQAYADPLEEDHTNSCCFPVWIVLTCLIAIWLMNGCCMGNLLEAKFRNKL
ncbi:hypothetical protein XELAEV_18002746mg [Xenopus laevis]|nr:hypothetical protein XELAEV_18002746mg [Xenopus laevis]